MITFIYNVYAYVTNVACNKTWKIYQDYIHCTCGGANYLTQMLIKIFTRV